MLDDTKKFNYYLCERKKPFIYFINAKKAKRPLN
jgi:hypothetical protein